EADHILQAQRRASRKDKTPMLRRVADLPDGAMIAADGQAYAVRGKHLLRWSFDGYTQAMPRNSIKKAELLTPPLFVEILSHGFQPRWHPSAAKLSAT
ncbi:MAG TPA: hypothetical protein VG742_24075, partial [Dongiaceae bacterium]|nr:hypothetical protein [Dongiaceae bacterium]